MSDDLRVIVWNVEHGSSAYAHTPNGLSILLDAGSSEDFSPALWLKSKYDLRCVHLFVLSHAHTDHLRDIENVDQQLKPCTFMRNKTVPRSLIYRTDPPVMNPLKHYSKFDARYRCELPADSPYRLRPVSNWGGVCICSSYNRYPEHRFDKLNDYSVATFLLYGNLEILFPGDLEAPGWEALLQRSDFRELCTPNPTNTNETRVLVAAHHGHKAGVSKPFLDLYRPCLTIISDVYGSPYTAADVYGDASSGFDVWDSKSERFTTRHVISTKLNNFILITATSSRVTVVI